jgi:ACT domain-containing protein
LGYDPTPIDLAALKERSSAAMPRLMAKDQEALREAMARLGDVQINAPAS